MSSITVDGGTLVYYSDYNPGLVAALKQMIPATDRRWDNARRAWLVAPAHGHTLVKLTSQYLGEIIGLPQEAAHTARETRIIEARYIGMTKDRGDGDRSAFGYLSGGVWGVVFPESVLRDWFGAEGRPDEAPTLYAVLGIKAGATPPELKGAYRRLVMQWHPDRCHEADATEQFRRIQHAYEILSVPAKRAKYDAGLALAGTLKQPADGAQVTNGAYRAPLRCGQIMAEGRETLGRFVAEKILAWQDITDSYGRVLVSSWPAGAQQPVEVWL